MDTIHHHFCGVIPPHILSRIASRSGPESSGRALATIEQMQQLVALRGIRAEVVESVKGPQKSRRVYDAKNKRQTPGTLVMDEHSKRVVDIEVNEAFDGAGVVYDFYWTVFGRSSIDGKGKRLDSVVHFGLKFDNALWDGRQMIYGDGDGKIFRRFTASPDVIGHEITHGHTQYLSGLGYSGQTGALNEHLSDAFGSIIKQWLYNQLPHEASWYIGEELFGPGVNAHGIRSLAAPGTAYDDPVLGKDPQPDHMRNYVVTTSDNGGVHINSGIPNKAFYLVATSLGGYSWQTAGHIWFVTASTRMRPDMNFLDFAHATVDVAGELYGNGGNVQESVAQAWALVGIFVPLVGNKAVAETGPLSPRKPKAKHSTRRPLQLAA
jgi:Zn-dependent metalloprotease